MYDFINLEIKVRHLRTILRKEMFGMWNPLSVAPTVGWWLLETGTVDVKLKRWRKTLFWVDLAYCIRTDLGDLWNL